jgi:hypothetical protein
MGFTSSITWGVFFGLFLTKAKDGYNPLDLSPLMESEQGQSKIQNLKSQIE